MTLPTPYLQLIEAGHGHGVLGRPTPEQANAHRAELGLPTTRPSGRPFWNHTRLEAWRDRALAHLMDTLLPPSEDRFTADDDARAQLALADTAVRDTWLLRFMRADPATQANAFGRLVSVMGTAAPELRPPAGTVLALCGWTLGRDDTRKFLAFATSNGAHPYPLADLTTALLDAGISQRDWVRSVLAGLSEADCRHPHRRAAQPDPADIGQVLADRGWALQVDQQVDLGDAIAWTGTLTHHEQAVATVTQHAADQEPVLYWPPGSTHHDTWHTDLHAAHATAATAVAALDLLAQRTPDPLAASHPEPLTAGSAAGPAAGPATGDVPHR